MMQKNLDKRLNAYREDMADSRLRGEVEASHYVDGKLARVCGPFADVLDLPSEKGSLQTQFLQGQEVKVFDQSEGWSWVQNSQDGYVGYLRDENLQFMTEPQVKHPSHIVFAPRTFIYPGPDLKLPRVASCSMGTLLHVTDWTTVRGTEYAHLESGNYIIADHIQKIGDWAEDPVAVAETLLHTPYLWGGNTGFGIDCSGLVSLANMICGRTVLRDSDMQAQSIGTEIEPDFENLQRGDLVFWKGHVGMMADRENLLHANGHTMNVALESLASARERISYLYSEPTCVRRP